MPAVCLVGAYGSFPGVAWTILLPYLRDPLSQRKNILWLVSWYPNRYDPFDGDFIQRHARAAALHHNIHVLFVKEAEDGAPASEEWRRATGLTEQLIYFPRPSGSLAPVRKWLSWRRLCIAAVRQYIRRQGRPQAVHVHVPWKAGLIALELKKRWQIPYLVTEHWGIYNPVVADSILTRSMPVRLALCQIFKEASLFLSVSRYLGKGVNELLVRKAFSIVPNVVDTTLFFRGKEQYERFTFLHVSNMVPLKDVEGILQAFARLVALKGRETVQLIMIGNRDGTYVKMAESLGLLNVSVFFRGEVAYREVGAELQRSHCLVLNSWIENSPCVIGEALCCGLPVIATEVGGIPELLDKSNGVLVSPRNPEQLYGAMLQMLENRGVYQSAAISQKAHERFGYGAVGAIFNEAYSSLGA